MIADKLSNFIKESVIVKHTKNGVVKKSSRDGYKIVDGEEVRMDFEERKNRQKGAKVSARKQASKKKLALKRA